MKWLYCIFLSINAILCADTLTLVNDSTYRLNAVIEDATGTILGEMVINAGDTSTWSLNYDYAGYGAEPEAVSPQMPYSVYWYCMNGKLYGTCMDVSSDSYVTAQSCGGDQQCGQEEE